MSSAARLSVRQERALVVAVEAGDRGACQQLVEAFLPEIADLAGRFQHREGVERRELLQEGVAGLLLAVRRFDPALGTPFWAYASFWVRKAMQELVADLTRPVVLSDRAVRGLAAVRAAHRDHVHAHGSEPTTRQLSQATGFTRRQVENLQAAARTPRSLDERWSADDDHAGTVGDRIADPAAEQAYEGVLDGLEVRQVRRLTEQLDERERVVIRAHYGLGEPAQTLSRIGGGLGVTAERARQIEVGALAKLRSTLGQPAAVRRA